MIFNNIKMRACVLFISYCLIICFIILPVNAQLRLSFPPAGTYWQFFDFNSTYKEQPEFVYEMRSFLEFMQQADTIWQYAAIDGLLHYASVSTSSFQAVAGLLTTIYDSPNSQLRDIFIARHVYEDVLEYSLLNKDDSEKYRLKLEHLRLNFPGHFSANFEVVGPDGASVSLFDRKSKYLLLYFYNPGCHACEEISNAIMNSQVINDATQKNQLEIMAVYTDLEKNKWLDFIADKPDWVHGWDQSQQIEGNGLYYLDAIPTMYLLDEKKNVLLKDCSLTQVEEHLF